jgi:hypothetical protein
MKQSIAGICVALLTFCGSVAYAFQQPAPHDKQMEALDKEQQKLKRETDPVDRAKSDLKIGELVLGFMNDAVKTGDLPAMQQRIQEYNNAIEDAHQTIINTDKNPHKKPRGYKDLEITLRRQIRELEDIGGALTYDQREPVDKARQKATDIREELLKALFGSQNVTPHQL